MTSSEAGPDLATETCARRLAPLGGGELAEVATPVSWYGPAHVPAGAPASEASIQALSGIMAVHGRDRGRPRRVGLEVASVAAGLLAAQGALAGGIARLRGATIPVVHTSVVQAALLLLSNYFVVATALGDAVPGSPLPAPGPPFCSADGRWFEIETLDPEPWAAFWSRLGAGDADLGRAWTMFQWRFERATCTLPPGLHEAAGRWGLVELRRVAAEVGMSLTPLRGYTEVLTERNGVGHPLVRPLDAPGEPLPAAPLARLGAAPAPLPLAGIRVVEATSRIQGPFAGMLLRMLGADVVRVQPPGGDYGRSALCLHRGKETVTLDLGSPAQRGELVELVAGADVFLHNWRPGKAAEWGLEFDDLAARHRRLVYAHASGWSDRPPAGRLLGTDFLVQAYAGVGNGLNPEDEPPFPTRMVLCDVVGGLVGAEGILTGLYRRELAGGPWEVRSSLLAGAMAVQAHVLGAMAAGTEIGRRRGRPVWGLLDHPLPTADGMLVVSVEGDDALARLCEVCGVAHEDGPPAAAERALADCLTSRPAAEWEGLLGDAGLPAAVAPDDLTAVLVDPRLTGLFEPVGTDGRAPRSPWAFG
ncbi:MAG: CoA transferase [Acidimicrobiales bacterium]